MTRALPFVLTLLVVGCATTRVPAQGTFRKSTPGRIVSMESPPLAVSQTAVGLVWGNVKGNPGEGAWDPNLALAGEVKVQLASRGTAAAIADEARLIPGLTDRSITLMMENWAGPVRDWYSDDGPAAVPVGGLPGAPPWVIEIGLGQYQVLSGRLLLALHLKVLDGASGGVIGRARCYNAMQAPWLGPADKALADDGRPFKELFQAEGRRLVKECLTQLGAL